MNDKTYVIKFDLGVPPYYYAGPAEGSLGFAPTTETAFHFDSKETAERMLANGYTAIAEHGIVVEL